MKQDYLNMWKSSNVTGKGIFSIEQSKKLAMMVAEGKIDNDPVNHHKILLDSDPVSLERYEKSKMSYPKGPEQFEIDHLESYVKRQKGLIAEAAIQRVLELHDGGSQIKIYPVTLGDDQRLKVDFKAVFSPVLPPLYIQMKSQNYRLYSRSNPYAAKLRSEAAIHKQEGIEVEYIYHSNYQSDCLKIEIDYRTYILPLPVTKENSLEIMKALTKMIERIIKDVERFNLRF